MNLLTPLGLLGLLGLIALILIYILKPNYQQKLVSSSYVWQRALRYKRKRMPMSKLRNILLFICQVLIIIFCAFMLAQPFLPSDKSEAKSEKIFVLDASASMRTTYDGSTRFKRAIEEIKKDTTKALSAEDGTVSLIYAGLTAQELVHREGAAGLSGILDQLDALVDSDETDCTYGDADLEGALKLAEEILLINPDAEVVFYTDNTYTDAGDVTVRNLSDDGVEWNASIRNVDAYVSSGYYIFRVDVGCYGRHERLTLNLDIKGVNQELNTVHVSYSLLFTGEEEQRFIIRTRPASNPAGDAFEDDDPIEEGAIYLDYTDISIYGFDSAEIYFTEVKDSFAEDNKFFVYGGRKNVLKVQYYSGKSNPFDSASVMAMRRVFGRRWEVQFDQIPRGGEPELEGYDLYIFEDGVPYELPKDGVVMIINPDYIPLEFTADLTMGYGQATGDFKLSLGDPHFLTTGMKLNNVTVSQYTPFSYCSEAFEKLWYINDDPVLLAKNDVDRKCVIMMFSVNMSYLPAAPELSMLFGNMCEYFFPASTDSHLYDVGDTATIRSFNDRMMITTPDESSTVNAFPLYMQLDKPGSYSLFQPLIGELGASGMRHIQDSFFVRIPQSENNIFAHYDEIRPLEGARKSDPIKLDLVLYLAIALVLLLFAEWFLQSRVHF